MTLDQHFSPSYVSEFLASLVPPDTKTVLEPSAGAGSIADALVKVGYMPDVIEMDPFYANQLKDKGYKVVGSNFLMFNPEEPYDVAVMNPPYTGGADTVHVEHALKCAKEVIALTRINIFASLERYKKIWSHCNLIGVFPFARRPKFSESSGTLRHDITAIHIQSLYHCDDQQEPVDFKVMEFGHGR